MLVLTRGPQDKVVFPNLGITVEILRISGSRVRVGIDAPQDVRVVRHELSDAFSNELQQADESHANQTLSHRFRNRLNTAHVALSLAEKQLNAGLQDRALATLHRAITEFDLLDAEIIPERPATPAKTDRPRALLVEDDANECELLSGYLELSGFDVDTAHDGLQAMVQLGRRERPDFILLDMHMPRMNGPQLIRSIRENPEFRGMRVFAVSGATAEDVQVQIGPHGVDRWFQKPIKPQALIDCMQEALGAASA